MNEEAQETAAGWLGSRQPREIMVAMIMSALVPRALDHAPKDQAKQQARINEELDAAIFLVDKIIKRCKELPPP